MKTFMRCALAVGALLSTSIAHAQTAGRVILADQQSGADMGEKITAADLALGADAGQIKVGSSGSISKVVTISANHSVACANETVMLTLATQQASFRLQS